MQAKVEDFTLPQQRAALAAKALSHPARIAIIEFLSTQKTCLTSQLSDHLPLSRGSIAQHFDALKELGWINTALCNDKVGYCLNTEKMQQDYSYLSQFLTNLSLPPFSHC